MKKILLSYLLFSFPLLLFSQSYSVQLMSGSFVPKAENFRTAKWSSAEVVQGRYYRYIQFYSIPTEEQKRELANKGVRLYDYIPNNTYVADISANAQTVSIDNRNIRAVFPIKGQNKLDVLLANKKYPN